MKKINFLLLFILLCLPACNTPQKAAYTTLASIGAAVDSSMKAAAKGMVAGKITPTQWQQISVKHEQFRLAYNTACDIAAGDLNKFTPADVLTIGNDLIALVQNLTSP